MPNQKKIEEKSKMTKEEEIKYEKKKANLIKTLKTIVKAPLNPK